MMLGAVLMTAPGIFCYSQPNCKLRPSQTLLLYPDGQESDKGLEGASGPCTSNGFTNPEMTSKEGNISYISDKARIDLYFPKKPNPDVSALSPG